MKERWRDIIGFEGLYQVSNLGRVRSLDRVIGSDKRSNQTRKGRILKPAKGNKFGHLKVNLWRNNNSNRVWLHRLVAEAFIGPCPDGQEVRHGPNGLTDNSIFNLSYGTRQDNNLDKRRDGTHNGKPVRRSDGIEFMNLHVAAEETGCQVSSICMACQDSSKSTGGS